MSAGGFCKDCGSGTIHDGTPTGNVTKTYDLDTYVAEPPNEPPKGIIVIIADGFGWTFNNNRIMADNYAKRSGCRVLMPDFLGTILSPHMMDLSDHVTDRSVWTVMKIPSVVQMIYHFVPFLIRQREAITKPRLLNWFRALRHGNPDTFIGAAGFCWGGRYTTYLCNGWNNPQVDAYPTHNVNLLESSKGKEEYLVDAGFTAHPSGLKIPQDVLTLRKPISFAAGTADFMLTEPQMKEVQGIFTQKNDGKDGAPECEIVEYSEAKHGFAVRWNPKNEREQKQGEQAEDQAMRWFEKQMAAKNSG